MMQSVGAIIMCSKTNKSLFLLREGAKFAGTWALPGGKVEAGESLMDALSRELDEEIGFACSSKIFPLEKYTSLTGNFCYHTFLIIVNDEFKPKLNHEHALFRWCSLDNVPRPLHPGLFKTLSFQDIKNKISLIMSNVTA